jgi:hypothetical protein
VLWIRLISSFLFGALCITALLTGPGEDVIDQYEIDRASHHFYDTFIVISGLMLPAINWAVSEYFNNWKKILWTKRNREGAGENEGKEEP